MKLDATERMGACYLDCRKAFELTNYRLLIKKHQGLVQLD